MPSPAPPSRVWRLVLDVPHEYAIKPGYLHAIHGYDLRTGTNQGIWKEPLSGVIMKKPSFLHERWASTLIDLSGWDHVGAFWKSYHAPVEAGGSSGPQLLSTVKPAGETDYSGAGLIVDLTVYGAIVTILSEITDDELIYALVSHDPIADSASRRSATGVLTLCRRKSV